MNDLPQLSFTVGMYLFPIREEELGELTAKMGILADFRSGSPIPVHHQCVALVWIGQADKGPRENASGVFPES